MKVIEPKELEIRRHIRAKKQKTKRRKRHVFPIIIFVLGIYVFASLLAPLPNLKIENSAVSVKPAGSVSMPWPEYGQSAIGAVGYGLLAENGEQTKFPIASVAKIVTAVAVLKARPLQQGDMGDSITISKSDVETYNKYLAQYQSVVEVEEGEILTQYQALQALLLPSANNMADILVRWAFGSSEEYLTYVNQLVQSLGMKNTVIADSSGFSPDTVSTAVDITLLGEIAMNQPVIAEIVAQPQADLPVAGIVYNVNHQLGSNGIVGIKTGNTDEAGGCYLFAAKRMVDDENFIVVVGTIIGAPDLSTSIKDSLPLLDEAFKNFKSTKLIVANQKVGTIRQTGGKTVDLIVQQGQTAFVWTGQAPTIDIVSQNVTSRIEAAEKTGVLKINVGHMTYQTNIVSADGIQNRDFLWRLRHAGGYL